MLTYSLLKPNFEQQVELLAVKWLRPTCLRNTDISPEEYDRAKPDRRAHGNMAVTQPTGTGRLQGGQFASQPHIAPRQILTP